jgi:hypothetical protein
LFITFLAGNENKNYQTPINGKGLRFINHHEMDIGDFAVGFFCIWKDHFPTINQEYK